LLEKNGQFVNVNCPACNSKKRKKFFEKDRLKYHTCVVCNTVYISPRPSSKILKEFYYQSKGYEAWTKYTFKVSEKSREKNLVIPRITLLKKYLKKYNVKSNLAIEIGPGYGTYTSYLKKKKFFKKVGVIEANKDLIENCKKRKLNFLANDFEKINIKEKVNLLSGFEVIEHLFSPIKFLKKAHKILSSNSLIFISCPNVHGFDNILLGKNSGTFDHEHLNYFNPKSIKLLFEKNKFKILHLSTPGKLDVDLVCKYAQKTKNF
jgi:SAM-dependent methyltransferase